MANKRPANSLVSGNEILVRFDDRNSESLNMEVYLFRIYACLALRSSFSRASLSFSSRMYTAFITILTGPTGVSFHSIFQNFPVS